MRQSSFSFQKYRPVQCAERGRMEETLTERGIFFCCTKEMISVSRRKSSEKFFFLQKMHFPILEKQHQRRDGWFDMLIIIFFSFPISCSNSKFHFYYSTYNILPKNFLSTKNITVANNSATLPKVSKAKIISFTTLDFYACKNRNCF